MASDDPAAVQARVDELKVELRSIVLQLAQGLVQQNNVAPHLLRCEFRDGRVCDVEFAGADHYDGS